MPTAIHNTCAQSHRAHEARRRASCAPTLAVTCLPPTLRRLRPRILYHAHAHTRDVQSANTRRQRSSPASPASSACRSGRRSRPPIQAYPAPSGVCPEEYRGSALRNNYSIDLPLLLAPVPGSQGRTLTCLRRTWRRTRYKSGPRRRPSARAHTPEQRLVNARRRLHQVLALRTRRAVSKSFNWFHGAPPRRAGGDKPSRDTPAAR